MILEKDLEKNILPCILVNGVVFAVYQCMLVVHSKGENYDDPPKIQTWGN